MPAVEINTLGESDDNDNVFAISTPLCFTNEELQSITIELESITGQSTSAMVRSRQKIGDGFVEKRKPGAGLLTGTLSDPTVTNSSAVQSSYTGWDTLIAAGRI